MIYLTVHLVKEIELSEPVYMRWMYPFARLMKILKGYLRNQNRPEGCIVESYICGEAVEFCSEYIGDAKMISVPTTRNTSTKVLELETQSSWRVMIGSKHIELC